MRSCCCGVSRVLAVICSATFGCVLDLAITHGAQEWASAQQSEASALVFRRTRGILFHSVQPSFFRTTSTSAMRAPTRARSWWPSAWPERKTLLELLRDVQHASTDFPDVLVAQPVHAGPPEKLGPCAILPDSPEAIDELRSKWVLSTRQVSGQEYTYTSGHAVGVHAGVKTPRSTQDWPRLPRRQRGQKRAVYLHAWIAVSAWGPPPSDRHEASHICGNPRCLLSTHIRWQLPLENSGSDRQHHKLRSGLEGTPLARYSKRAWPGRPRAGAASGRAVSALGIMSAPRTRSVSRTGAQGAPGVDASESSSRVLFRRTS